MALFKTFKSIGINTAVQSIGKFTSAALSAISVILLTRYLGVSGYGNFSLIFAYLTFFSAFTDFGLQTTIVNKLSKKEFTKEKIFGTYLLIKLIVIIIVTLFSLFILIFMPYDNFIKFAIIFSSIGVAIGALGGFGNTFFQYQIRLDRITYIDLVNRFISLFLIIIFIFLNFGFLYILSAILISNVLSVILMFYILNKEIPINFNLDIKLGKSLIIESAPIGIAGFLSITYFKLDTLMLSFFKSSSEVGIYSLSYKVFENAIIIWTFYMYSFYPFLARFHHSKNINKYNQLIKNSILISIALSLAIIAIGFLLTPIIIEIFGGKNFSLAVTPLRILLISAFFVFINSIFYSIYFIKNKTKIIIICLLLSLIFNFFINLFIIPQYGVIGASISTVLTELFLFICYGLIYIKINK